jgi:hypothetical protein
MVVKVTTVSVDPTPHTAANSHIDSLCGTGGCRTRDKRGTDNKCTFKKRAAIH